MGQLVALQVGATGGVRGLSDGVHHLPARGSLNYDVHDACAETADFRHAARFLLVIRSHRWRKIGLRPFIATWDSRFAPRSNTSAPMGACGEPPGGRSCSISWLRAGWQVGWVCIPGAHAHAATRLRVLLREPRGRHAVLQLWLGHNSIQHTVRYAELSAERFKDW